jgi:hypothetical protein
VRGWFIVEARPQQLRVQEDGRLLVQFLPSSRAAEVPLGPGRIAALYHGSPTSCQIR